jgi:FtsH-binding integral membrane protein
MSGQIGVSKSGQAACLCVLVAQPNTHCDETHMAKQSFFALGLANNILLILIFVLRGNHLDLVQSYGWLYLLLAIPAIYVMFLMRLEPKRVQYQIFLAIFLAFLVLEGLLDFVWKVPFRENWRILVPYLALYYAMNYGFIVMVWKESRLRGVLMLALFAIQIAANVSTE